ncbi:NFX1-type zinc finger-containing protein 1-like isoform X2 [Eurosta solidaginis]|uniref:NFX1-type zinc finger-containing protein 1-like isoform X2 n=1 Tax=Eurosta solidaginis TaxID=178769 RepID=UPI0035307A3E
MACADSDDQDWFDKDENEILQNFRAKASETESVNHAVEYIHGPSAADEHLQQKRLEVSTELTVANKVDHAKRLTTEVLRKLKNMSSLDLFLFVTTCKFNFFVNQIRASDGLERILLYLRISSRLFELELHGFQKEFLEKFSQNEEFFEQIRDVAVKLFLKGFKTLWKSDEDAYQILIDIKSLILRLHREQLITYKALDVITDIREYIKDSDYPDIVNCNSCKQLVVELDAVLNGSKAELSEKVDVYPSLDELITCPSLTSKADNSFQNIKITDDDDTKYIEKQKKILRDDFIMPLRDALSKIKESQSAFSFENVPQLYENVGIVVNKDFINGKCHEMLLIDMFRYSTSYDKRSRQKLKDNIKAIKTGSLLVLSPTKNFENLILATVTFTDAKRRYKGYIGIQIVRQHNIGCVYDKKFYMFESPAFFEAYNNVFNYFYTYGDGELPMKRYIVDGEKDVRQPNYLKQDMSYTFDGDSFKLKNSSYKCKPRKLSLNQSQWVAYLEALTKEFCLIQGPPGTGKTHLSVNLVRTLIENARTPIVLITYTNDSLDKFLLKLSAYTRNILRFGSQTRLPEISKFNVNFDTTAEETVNPHLKRLYHIIKKEFKKKFQKVQSMHANFDGSEDSYQLLINAQKDVSDVAEKLKSIRLMFQFYSAREADVIAMTTNCAAKSNFLFRLLQSKIVIFEEAAEISEPHALACLTPYTEHIIMIGDHMQLQPYTSSFYYSYDLNISLFERLFVNNLKGSTLHIQYRMRPCIADLMHPTFYEVLKNDAFVESYPKVPYMTANLFFYTHKNNEDRSLGECSVFNNFEAEEIIYLATHLLTTAAYTSDDIVILSPYAKQVEHLKQCARISHESLQHVNIATVDSFQGLEANIVLLSLVRSNTEGQIGILRNKNRICVALSRAKHGMYIIGDMSTLTKCSEIWRTIELKLRAQCAIGNHFPFNYEE